MKNNKINISQRCGALTQSEIRNMSIECEKISGVNLSQGVCDVALPTLLADYVDRAVKEGFNQYTRYDGLKVLRDAIAEKSLRYNNIVSDPEKNIVVSGGSTGAFYCACLALLDPGDEVILFEPYYGYHVNTLMAVEANIRYVKLFPHSWEFSLDELESVVSQRTKAVVINTPANPSGKVFTYDELNALADFCIRHNLIIFTDEIYEYIVFDGRKHISPASLPKIQDRTVTISGYSKTFSITGWRIGYSICNDELARMIGFMNDLVYVCAPAPLQASVAYAVRTIPDKFYSELSDSYNAKKIMICEALKDCGLEPFVPQGAYYVLTDAGKLPGKTSKEKAMYLLNRTGVASVPGNAFYHDDSGDNILRFCFAKSNSELEKACESLSKVKRI